MIHVLELLCETSAVAVILAPRANARDPRKVPQFRDRALAALLDPLLVVDANVLRTLFRSPWKARARDDDLVSPGLVIDLRGGRVDRAERKEG